MHGNQCSYWAIGEGGREYHVHPVFLVRNQLVGRVADEAEDLGLRVTLDQIDPVKKEFSFSVSTTQKDYVILKAAEKPFINLLWSGTLLMTLGFFLGLRGRRGEKPGAAPVAPEPWMSAISLAS